MRRLLQIVRRRSRLLRPRTMSRLLLLSVAALALAPAAAGAVRLYSGGLAVVSDPYGPPRLVDRAAGRVHALYGSEIGSGFATRMPVRGHVTFDARGATIAGRRV